MARPKEFDRNVAVERAKSVFWRQGYVATSTDDLLQAMNVGRQSMYDTFGDKRRLYLEALTKYNRDSVAANISRLRSTSSPLAGIRAMVTGLIPADKASCLTGCMGVNSISELGAADADLNAAHAESARLLRQAIVERICEAQTAGEIKKAINIERAATFVETIMAGLQIGAKAGIGSKDLRDTAAFAITLLKKI